MTVTTNENLSNSYVADGTQDQFEIRFKWYEVSEVQVLVDDVVISSGFSVVTQAGDPDSSNDAIVIAHVVFDTPPSNGALVKLQQNLNVSQLIDYLAYGKFPAEDNENGLDKLTLIAQKIKSELTTTVKAITAPAKADYAVLPETVNGSQNTFTIDSDAIASTIEVYVYGTIQFDWSYNAGVVTLGFAPKENNGNEVFITYEKPTYS